MRGRRVYPVERDGKMWLPSPEYGDYCCYEGEWWVAPPYALEQEIVTARGKLDRIGPVWGGIFKHEVEEHEDGTITVSPSIAAETGERRYHGYLRRGEWTAVGQ